ncbi:hypothetical protein K488DRAFT_75042 [Vararia minispora EC-137]|uniref:Uncharacterized protein n=1 Tax=Vararia minispora EC-137 TaxID=1314806 RepID=A0ACB8Q4X4_9AGAM|nr:hypothetical protein K488DRAFT_75042 [Vararia minispora EC-137]
MPVTRSQASQSEAATSQHVNGLSKSSLCPHTSHPPYTPHPKFRSPPSKKKSHRDLQGKALEEAQIQDTITEFKKKGGKYLELVRKHNVPYWKFYRRVTGQTEERHAAHAKERTLTDVEEGVLVEWAKFLSFVGIPWFIEKIQQKVLDLVGHCPSRDWVNCFFVRHPELNLFKGSHLNGKHTWCIPARNVYNFDELGIQLCGGQMNSGRKYIFSVKDKSKHHISNDNLKLIIVLKTVCLNGLTPIKPLFVFSSGKSMYHSD